jgi:hypothetical protein
MDGQIMGHYVPRKVIYSFFLMIIVSVIILLVLFVSFSQALKVSDAQISVIGTEAELGMVILNTSGHMVRDAVVVIDTGERVVNEKIPGLAPGEDYNFLKRLEIPQDLLYKVTIAAPYNQPININFEINESTIDPVTAEVTLSKTMVVGETYDLQVNLCNISPSTLPDVRWQESFSGTYFSEESLSRSISLDLSQCKYLYSTLTPIKAGLTKIDFKLIVGSAEKNYSQELIIVEPEEDTGDVDG